ncbi:hypothetical protein TGAM01_v202224 [Trichoderma gamsii]|uniref:Endoplasmic reticulum junction formation protein lunapark n=2 Tax=Trichoderma gamsii TaxID=398673 RepID=A0A2P4ZXV2_9HYPO|nr:hypothetical protein TGAM01_v202224 [Trichoderma gamsii]PON29116.1 hypothetical protein TGAM01_v202224 [Trichoderma gamsii]
MPIMSWLWPWKRSDPSPASFEKALSGLSKKIATTQSRLEWTRLRFRKIKVLGTLYTSFAYLVAVIVLLLVVGYPNLGPMDWTGMAGGPVFIYTTRVVITSYYNFRIESLEAKLKALQEERQDTIQKLKEATKYDSTLELLEKYGGAEGKDGKPQIKIKEDAPQQQQQQQQQPGFSLPERTHIPPPATANIPRRDLSPASFASSRPVTPQTQSVTSNDEPSAIGQHLLRPQSAQSQHHGFPPPPPQAAAEPHWYDRIFDVLLGEDETAAKNRIVLICQVCRLVNGQAPPGTKSLSELGMWKCMACGSRNGEMDEGKRIVREVLKSHGKKGGKAASANKEPTTATITTDLGDDQAEPETSTESQPTTPLSATSQTPSPLEGDHSATLKPRRSARNKRS